jgi:hypothetical protein
LCCCSCLCVVVLVCLFVGVFVFFFLFVLCLCFFFLLFFLCFLFRHHASGYVAEIELNNLLISLLFEIRKFLKHNTDKERKGLKNVIKEIKQKINEVHYSFFSPFSLLPSSFFLLFLLFLLLFSFLLSFSSFYYFFLLSLSLLPYFSPSFLFPSLISFLSFPPSFPLYLLLTFRTALGSCKSCLFRERRKTKKGGSGWIMNLRTQMMIPSVIRCKGSQTTQWLIQLLLTSAGDVVMKLLDLLA